MKGDMSSTSGDPTMSGVRSSLLQALSTRRNVSAAVYPECAEARHGHVPAERWGSDFRRGAILAHAPMASRRSVRDEVD